MERVVVENMRCFLGRHVAPLAPVTLLVGENSSGKSTFLAATRIAFEVAHGEAPLDFNKEPFQLGAYEQIANYRGGRGGLSKSFAVGIDFQRNGLPDSAPPDMRVMGTFGVVRSNPVLNHWALDASLSEGRYQVEVGLSKAEELFRCTTPTGRLDVSARKLGFGPNPVMLLSMMEYVVGDPQRSSKVEPARITSDGRVTREQVQTFGRLARDITTRAGRRVHAFAPIRTRPHRTYDPATDVEMPEGSHVPMVLATLSSGDPAAWEALRKSLDAFGSESGLFGGLQVRRLGRKQSDPFQIRVKIAGPAFNLTDVGYGVSQVVPIVVDCLRGPDGSTFLLQQPEVHLHPRAQAALGTFLSALAKHGKKRFLVETHSDYLVDRIRMEIREGLLAPEDAVLLFFERKAARVRIHALRFDKKGNLLGAPVAYRRFFLDEETKLIGF